VSRELKNQAALRPLDPLSFKVTAFGYNRCRGHHHMTSKCFGRTKPAGAKGWLGLKRIDW